MLHPPQDPRNPKLGGKSVERAPKFVDGHFLRRVLRPRGHQGEARRQLLATVAGQENPIDLSDRDRDQPRAKPGGLFQVLDPLDGVDERLLQHVFQFVVAPEQAIHHARQVARVPRVKKPVRSCVVSPEAFDKVEVVDGRLSRPWSRHVHSITYVVDELRAQTFLAFPRPTGESAGRGCFPAGPPRSLP